MIRVVFLDIDNTLLSFSEYVKSSMRAGFEHFGLTPYTESMFPLFESVNNRLWKQVEQGALSLDDLFKVRWNTVFKELGIEFDGVVFERYFREGLFNSAIPEPYSHELLDYLSKRYVLCAASNGPYEQQLNRLRKGDMYGFFTHFFISSRVGAPKPEKAFFDHCFNVLGASGVKALTPDETVIIGDSAASDIAGGLSYGMHTCLYDPSGKDGENRSGAEYTVSSLEKIMHIL